MHFFRTCEQNARITVHIVVGLDKISWLISLSYSLLWNLIFHKFCHRVRTRHGNRTRSIFRARDNIMVDNATEDFSKPINFSCIFFCQMHTGHENSTALFRGPRQEIMVDSPTEDFSTQFHFSLIFGMYPHYMQLDFPIVNSATADSLTQPSLSSLIDSNRRHKTFLCKRINVRIHKRGEMSLLWDSNPRPPAY